MIEGATESRGLGRGHHIKKGTRPYGGSRWDIDHEDQNGPVYLSLYVFLPSMYGMYFDWNGVFRKKCSRFVWVLLFKLQLREILSSSLLGKKSVYKFHIQCIISDTFA